MKKILVLAAAMAMFASSAFAAGTATVDVSATVVGSCVFNTANATLAFPFLDATVVGPVAGSTSLDFQCASGVSFTISDDTGGAPVMTSTTLAPAQTIPYSLNYTATGTASGLNETLVVNASVAYADFQNAWVDTYTDTVVFTINP
ncbi:MAG: spore coat protein U domain-containing protein [Desulfuromonadales bacterium]|nr:spore coat protein U domain-containing protein [Desulfuromonadales bacterium]